MPNFKVLRPIEMNGTLYLPTGATPPNKPRSAGNGEAITVDPSGVIELTADRAAVMTQGQIQAISAQQPAASDPEPKKQKAKSRLIADR